MIWDTKMSERRCYESLSSLSEYLGLPETFLREMVDTHRIPFVGTGKYSVNPNNKKDGRRYFDAEVVRECLNEIAEWQRSRRAGEPCDL